MTPKEAFKIGFLHKCAADGLSPDETMERIRHATLMMKTAGPIKDVVDTVKAPVGWAANKAFNYGVPLALFGPPILGLGAGYALSKMRDDTFDKDEARKKEEIAEYQRAVEKLRRLRDRQLRMA